MLALGNTQKEKKKNTIFVFIGLLLVLVLTACQSQPPTIEEPEPTSMPTATVLPPTDTLVPASPTSSPTVETYTDLIQYPGVFHIHRYLSVRLPEDGTPPYPTVLLFHSGGFAWGDKADLDEVAMELSERGFAAVNVNFSLKGHPMPVEDAFCALAWVYEEAKVFGFDTDRVITLGADSGGSLAALLGLITDPSPYLEECPNTTLPAKPVAGVVSYSAIYNYALEEDFLNHLVFETTDNYVARNQDGFEQRVVHASPVSYIHSEAPPFLLIHGLDDSLLPADHSEKFVTALQAESVPVEYIAVPDVNHYSFKYPGVPVPTLEEMQLDIVEAFIRGL